MKLGFLTGALENISFEEKMNWASEVGFDCVEVSCWPQMNTRDYSASDIDVVKLDNYHAENILRYLDQKNISISSLAYYDNNLHEDLNLRKGYIEHLKKVIDAAVLLNVELVGTFVGRNRELSIEENFREFKEVFSDILEYSEKKKIKIMIENCPMPGWSVDGLAGTISYSPELWDEMFRIFPTENFGLNYDPSHLMWLGIDYLKALKDYKDRIFHIHAKDGKVNFKNKHQYSIFGKQLGKKNGFDIGWVDAKIPGKGEIKWDEFFDTIREIGYDGVISIEHEDPEYEDSIKKCKEGILFSKNYLEKFIK
ncbi:sugar phosphate isomerase/epimerase [Clostridium sediminicola]|uniref:sugar phosphate isomerase/epimerase family protein n=1 Tax=Clostridium sediminicola TaxID=3114879 RepID=UPI0031F27616